MHRMRYLSITGVLTTPLSNLQFGKTTLNLENQKYPFQVFSVVP